MTQVRLNEDLSCIFFELNLGKVFFFFLPFLVVKLVRCDLKMIIDMIPASRRKSDCESDVSHQKQRHQRERETERESEALVPVVADVKF